jgi:hypothetical protein
LFGLARLGVGLGVHHIGRFDVAVVRRVDKVLLRGVDCLDELGHLPLCLHLVLVVEDFGDRFGRRGTVFFRTRERRSVDAPEGAVAYESATASSIHVKVLFKISTEIN